MVKKRFHFKEGTVGTNYLVTYKKLIRLTFLRKNLNNILLATTKTNESIISQFLLQNTGPPKMCSKHIIFTSFSYLTLLHLTLLRCPSFSQL